MVINVTLLYFVLLIPLSGFIAWLGDRIGHKSGKRRHTLFGLRPRHTAMVFTVGTGMCISLVAFGIVFLLSATFRRVVRDGGRLYEINRELKHDNIALTQGNLVLKGTVDQDKRDAAAALIGKKEAEKQEAQAKAQAATAQSAADHAQAELQRATAHLAEAETNLAQTKASLGKTQESLGDKERKLTAAQASVADAQNHVAQAKKQAQQSGLAAQKANGELTAAQARVTKILATSELAIDQQKHALDEQKQQLQAQKIALADQNKQLVDARAQYDEQKKKLADLGLQIADNEKKLEKLQTNAEALREHRITYQVGEEVNRLAIPPGHTVFRIESMLREFMRASADKAVLRGAHKDNGTSAAVIILPHVVIPGSGEPTPNSATQVVTEDDTIRFAAESIRAANTDVFVIASAVANAVRGEPVAVSLKLRKNPVIFPAETQISDVRINGHGSKEQISDAFMTFLVKTVRPTLLNAGIVPASQGGENEASDPDGATLVNLSSDDWLNIMDNIRLAGSNARVVVTAEHDVRAGDLPPALHFEVKGVPSTFFRNNTQ